MRGVYSTKKSSAAFTDLPPSARGEWLQRLFLDTQVKEVVPAVLGWEPAHAAYCLK